MRITETMCWQLPFQFSRFIQCSWQMDYRLRLSNRCIYVDVPVAIKSLNFDVWYHVYRWLINAMSTIISRYSLARRLQPHHTLAGLQHDAKRKLAH